MLRDEDKNTLNVWEKKMREMIRQDVEHNQEALTSFIQAGFEAAPSCPSDIDKRRGVLDTMGVDYAALDRPLSSDDDYHPLQGPAPTD